MLPRKPLTTTARIVLEEHGRATLFPVIGFKRDKDKGTLGNGRIQYLVLSQLVNYLGKYITSSI